jgi:hypothetical protein
MKWKQFERPLLMAYSLFSNATIKNRHQSLHRKDILKREEFQKRVARFLLHQTGNVDALF